jgi:hypothetical protein
MKKIMMSFECAWACFSTLSGCGSENKGPVKATKEAEDMQSKAQSSVDDSERAEMKANASRKK